MCSAVSLVCAVARPARRRPGSSRAPSGTGRRGGTHRWRRWRRLRLPDSRHRPPSPCKSAKSIVSGAFTQHVTSLFGGRRDHSQSGTIARPQHANECVSDVQLRSGADDVGNVPLPFIISDQLSVFAQLERYGDDQAGRKSEEGPLYESVVGDAYEKPIDRHQDPEGHEPFCRDRCLSTRAVATGMSSADNCRGRRNSCMTC